MKSPITVTTIRCTCCACPAQWEGLTNDAKVIYARHRWGHLTVRLQEPNSQTYGQTIFSCEHGGKNSGDLDYDTLKKLTKGIVQWPEHES